jgi:HK97 family phage major capsid protein
MADARSKVSDLPARHAKPGEARVVDGELTYRKFEGRADNWQDPAFHYLRDLYRAQCKSDPEAVKRLVQHGAEAAIEGRADQGNTTDGTGGEFVPPLWLQDEWIALPRPGRPAAALIQNRPLPPGTDSINLPKITTGTLVAAQTEVNSVTSQAIVTTSVTAALQTMAGQIDVSQQIIDRSNPTIDAILFDDLAAAYDTQIDTAVLNSTVTNGKGFLQLSGTISVSYTDASPTVPELYPKGADALQQIATNIYMPADAWLMHPRRWAFFLAALDTQNRPLIVPSDAPGFNQAGVAAALGIPAESVAGSWHGLPVVLDASIPTNLGAGTNEDRIIGCGHAELDPLRGRDAADAGARAGARQHAAGSSAALQLLRPDARPAPEEHRRHQRHGADGADVLGDSPFACGLGRDPPVNVRARRRQVARRSRTRDARSETHDGRRDGDEAEVPAGRGPRRLHEGAGRVGARRAEGREARPRAAADRRGGGRLRRRREEVQAPPRRGRRADQGVREAHVDRFRGRGVGAESRQSWQRSTTSRSPS